MLTQLSYPVPVVQIDAEYMITTKRTATDNVSVIYIDKSLFKMSEYEIGEERRGES